MTDVPVSEIILYQACVVATLSKGKATGMAEHMGVYPDGQPGHDTVETDNLPETLTGDVCVVS